MIAMSAKSRSSLLTLVALLVLMTPLTFAKTKATKLAKKLLYGNETTRTEAIKAFNQLPAEEQ